jgi:pimeloyl-ACP methyl ester carboxylesterase
MEAVCVSSAHIVGASMGGMIGQEMALKHPNRIASLTLVCTVAAVDEEMAGVLRAWKASRPHVAADNFTLSLSAWLFTHRFFQQVEAVRGFMQLVRGNPFPQSVEGFQRQCDAVHGHNAADRVSTIAAPTHVIVGAEDILTPPRHSRALAAAIRGAQLTEVPAAAHVLWLEKPEDFNRALIGFLQSQPIATA